MGVNTAVVFSSIATCIIALYSWRSYELTKEMKRANDLKEKADQAFKQQVKDLYQAIVVATIISTPNMVGQYSTVINTFKAHYKGNTPIFED